MDVTDPSCRHWRGMVRGQKCEGWISQHAANLRDARLTDEQLALHRPGCRIGATDTAARDAKQAARDEYLDWLTTAWRNPTR